MNIKKKSDKQEKRIAKDFGGRTRAGSGNQWHSKADVICAKFLIEAKYTDDYAYTLKLSTWNKIEKEAARESLRIPLMRIDIRDLKLVIFSDKHIDMAEYMNFNGYCDLSISNKQLKLSKCEVESILSEGEYMTIKFMDYSNLLFVMRESDFKLYIDDSMEQ